MSPITVNEHHIITVKPPIKDTLKEDEPLNKGRTKCTIVYIIIIRTNSVQNNLNNLSTKDKMLGPKACPH